MAGFDPISTLVRYGTSSGQNKTLNFLKESGPSIFNLALNTAERNINRREAKKDASLQNSIDATQTAADIADRNAALRRAMASQRASFAARGINPDSGSAEAVLLGFFNLNEADTAARLKLDGLRQSVRDNSLKSDSRRNLLSLTTDLGSVLRSQLS